MATSEVHKYEVWCTTDSKYVYTWGTEDEVPTTCPENTGHSIDTNLTSVVETISTSSFQVKENTEGYFETTHIIIDVLAGSPGDVTYKDVTWPMDVLLWKTELKPDTSMIGDVISVIGAPDTVLGGVTAPVSIGDTVINVNSTVTANINRGFIVALNGTRIGRCSAIDAVGGTITIDTATVDAFSAGVPVTISVYVLKEIYIVDTDIIAIGSKGFKGKTVNAGDILRVEYTNNSGTAKTVRWRPEYYANG